MPTKKAPAPPQGPRGGLTTVSKSGALVRKTVWIGAEEAEALRAFCYRERRPESEVFREGLRRVLGLGD